MIRQLSILILALSMSTYTPLKAADNDNEIAEPPAKKGKLERKEIAINLKYQQRDVIVKLDLSFNPYLDNINFILGFPKLTDLNLSDCENLKDNYHPVSQLINLRTLNISSMGLTTTRYLKPLINLTSLDISCGNMKKCLKHIVRLPALKELILSGDTSGLDQLTQLTSLEKLNLKGMFNNDEDDLDYECPSLDFLSSLTSLRTLNLGSSDYLISIEPIVNLPNLTDLDLSFSKSIVDLKEISKLKSIVKLNLGGLCYPYIRTIKKDLKSLKELKNLRSLTISPSAYIPKLPKEVIIHRKFTN